MKSFILGMSVMWAFATWSYCRNTRIVTTAFEQCIMQRQYEMTRLSAEISALSESLPDVTDIKYKEGQEGY